MKSNENFKPDLDHTEICLAHQEQAWSIGNCCSVEEVIQLFPIQDTEQETETLLALVCNEVFLREENGESPTLIEYQVRFPHLAELLQTQWEIDGLLTLQESVSKLNYRASQIGRLIDRYEILSELGRGAMGVVYLAWDPKLKRQIALKRLRTGADSSGEEIDRVRTEAEAIAQIQHPSIVQIFDVGEVDELPFLAMEYCAGGTLAMRLGGKPILPALAAEIINRICAGVSAAHQRRIIHRDLKPKNILLERDGDWSPRISDFGLAKILDSDSTATATGSVLGTPAYMSPEQAFGDAKRVGPAADIYSLGAIMYECLTGRPPFVGVTVADTLQQVRQREPVPVRQLEPNVPLDLETITHKCMQKEPRQRYESVAELQEDLSRFLNRQPILARRERWYETAGRLARKYPLVTGLTTSSAMLLLAVTAISLVFARSMMKANARIQASEVAAKLGQAEAWKSVAHSIRVTHEPGQRFEALDVLRKAIKIGHDLDQPAKWFDSIRDEAIGALVLPDAHISQFQNEGRRLQFSDFTDDHRLLALCFESGPISIRQLADHHELTILPRLDEISSLGFIDNNRLFQSGMPGGALELWNLENNVPQRIWKWTPSPSFKPLKPSTLKTIDTKIAIVGDPQVIEVLSVADGTTLAKFSPKPYIREPVIALHPTHPYFVIHSYFEPGIELRNWNTGETLLRYVLESDKDAAFTGATWSKDGRQLALITEDDGSVLVRIRFDPDTKELKCESAQSPAPNGNGGGPSLRFNTRGDRLLVYAWDSRFGLVDANLGLPVFASHPFITSCVGTPKDDPQERYGGIFCLSGDTKRYGMMSIAHGRERTFLQSESERGGSLSVSNPTGQLLAFAYDNTLNIVDVATKSRLLSRKWQDLDIYSLHFDDYYLYVNSTAVCFRFPYHLSAGKPATLELGVPERVHIPGSVLNIAASRDGKTIASSCPNKFGTSQYLGCWAKLELEPAARKIVDNVSGDSAAVSVDGSLIGFATEKTSSIQKQINGKLEQARALAHAKQVFSADGKWVMSDKTILGTEVLYPKEIEFEGALSDLTLDGNQVAAEYNNTTSLSDARTGKVFATLEGIHPWFLPDGSKVVTRVGYRHTLYDMKLIRQGVLDLGIPWSGPDYSNCREPAPIELAKFVAEIESVETLDKLLFAMDLQCEKRAQANPEDGHLAFSAAMISLDRRHWPEALERLDRSCKLLPEAITPRQWRSYLLAEMRRWTEAIADADWVLDRITDSRFRLHRAEWLFRNQNFTRSTEECKAIIASKQGFITYSHGLLHLNQIALGDHAQAALDLDFFLKNLHDDASMLSQAAYFMVGSDISLRQPTLAKLYVDKLLTLQNDFSPDIRDKIGMVYYRNDEYVRAIDCLLPNLADTTNEFYGYAMSVIAMCNAKLGNREAAEQNMQDLESWKPTVDMNFSDQHSIEQLKAEARQVLHHDAE